MDSRLNAHTHTENTIESVIHISRIKLKMSDADDVISGTGNGFIYYGNHF